MTKPQEIPDNRSAWEKAQPERKNCEECGWPHDACCCEPPTKAVKPYCGECGGAHEPSGARSDCVLHWKRRATEAENKLNVVKHFGVEGIKPLHVHDWQPLSRYPGGWQDVCVTCGEHRNVEAK